MGQLYLSLKNFSYVSYKQINDIVEYAIWTHVQGAEKVREHRKNRITFTPENGFKPKFQNY